MKNKKKIWKSFKSTIELAFPILELQLGLAILFIPNYYIIVAFLIFLFIHCTYQLYNHFSKEDYTSEKIQELIDKIENMSVEEFESLYKRAEKDLEDERFGK
jgi:hypothetical protein